MMELKIIGKDNTSGGFHNWVAGVEHFPPEKPAPCGDYVPYIRSPFGVCYYSPDFFNSHKSALKQVFAMLKYIHRGTFSLSEEEFWFKDKNGKTVECVDSIIPDEHMRQPDETPEEAED
jgi:hypothetical protein